MVHSSAIFLAHLKESKEDEFRGFSLKSPSSLTSFPCCCALRSLLSYSKVPTSKYAHRKKDGSRQSAFGKYHSTEGQKVSSGPAALGAGGKQLALSPGWRALPLQERTWASAVQMSATWGSRHLSLQQSREGRVEKEKLRM